MNNTDGWGPPQRLPTGVAGFDHISMGGLVAGRTNLIAGTSGSGKTLLACEILEHSITHYQRPAVFVTFEERPREIIRNVRRLAWDFEAHQEAGHLDFVDASMDRSLVGETGSYDLSGIIEQIRHAIRRTHAPLVVLDSLGGLFQQFQNTSLLRSEILRIAESLQDLGATVVMTAERVDEYGSITRSAIEEYISDCVIILRQSLFEERVRRTIQVYKLRGDFHHHGEFPFVISPQGMTIMPLSALGMTESSTLERVSTGNAILDQMAGGGLFRDSVSLVSGPTGSGKTLLATTFSAEACQRGERVLFVSYEESRPQLLRNAMAWGIDFEGWERKGLLRLHCEHPEYRGAEGHLLEIDRQIQAHQPHRLVIDSVSALERIAPLRTFREFVIGLTSTVRQRGVCSLLTSTTPQLSGGDSITDAHISTITDSIILLRYVEREGQLSRGIAIIKMRGSQHDKDVREYLIDGNGLQLGRPFGNVPNILTGIPSIEPRAWDEPAD